MTSSTLSETHIRYVFFNSMQDECETFDDYLTKLQTNIRDCNFDFLEHSLLRDQIVRGIYSGQVRQMLFTERDLNLNKTIEICRASEKAATQSQEMSDTYLFVDVNKTSIKHENIETEQQVHPEVIIKEEILEESFPNEQQPIKIHNPLLIKDEDIKIEQDSHTEELIIKNEEIHETSEESDTCVSDHQKYSPQSNFINTKRIYTGERFSCSFCDKTFASGRNLVEHLRIHTGVKPFSCDVCDKKFTQKTNLVQHKRIHTGKKSFPCDVCDKIFTTKSNVVVHKRIHSGEKPFSCNVCDKKFSYQNSLVIHKRVHNVEKPFSCNVCDRTFGTQSVLVRHTLTHTGEKPFSCDLCDKTFTRRSTLVRHQKNLEHSLTMMEKKGSFGVKI